MSNFVVSQMIPSVNVEARGGTKEDKSFQNKKLCQKAGKTGQEESAGQARRSNNDGLVQKVQDTPDGQVVNAEPKCRSFKKILDVKLALKTEGKEETEKGQEKQGEDGTDSDVLKSEGGFLLSEMLTARHDTISDSGKPQGQAENAVKPAATEGKESQQIKQQPRTINLNEPQKQKESSAENVKNQNETKQTARVAETAVSKESPAGEVKSPAEEIKAKSVVVLPQTPSKASQTLPQAAPGNSPEPGENVKYPATKTTNGEKAKSAEILPKSASDILPKPAIEQKFDGLQLSASIAQADKIGVEPGVSARSIAAGQGVVAAAKGFSENPAARPVEQLLGHIQANLSGPNQQIRLTLTPPELGTVRITFQQQGQEITGLIEVQKADVRREVEQASGQLMTAMNQAGVQIRRIEVVNFNATQDKLLGQDQQPVDYRTYGDSTDRQGWTGNSQNSTGRQTGRTSLPELTEDVMQQLVTDKSLNMYV